MKTKAAVVLAAWALVMGAMAGTPSVSAHGPGDWHQAVAYQSAAQPSAAQRCSEYHKFGGQPVDVAKSADNSRVLARVLWGYSAEWGFCYLVLDDSATETLRASAGQLADPSPDDADPAAAARCSRHHRFGGQPVDVAKTADNSRTLAQAHWNYNAQHNICYLTLNPAATEALRNPPPTTPPGDNGDTDPPSSPGTALNITATPRYRQITVTWSVPDSTESPPGTGYVVAYKANATACPTDIDVREITWATTNDVHFSHLTWDYINTPNTEVTIPAPSIGTPYLVCVASNSPIADRTWATATATPSAVYKGTYWASRGNILVKTHVCVAPDLAQLIEPSYISRTVELWNNLEAPFYSWQSSELLTMHMEAGKVIESRILQEKSYEQWSGWNEVAPIDCTETIEEQENTIHHFLVLHDPNFKTPGGLGGPGWAGTHIKDLLIRDLTEKGQLNSKSFSAVTSQLFWVTSHELDHALGIPHNNGSDSWETKYPYDVPIHRTRGRIDPTTESNLAIGTFAGQTSNFAQAYSFWNSNLRVAYYCYDVRDLGWPMGDDKPACVRAHPANRSNLDVEVAADDKISVSWGESSFPQNDESVSGYRIELEQLKTQEDGRVGWTLVSSHTLDASATSFTLPSQPVGRYRVKLLLSWTLENDFFLSVGPAYAFNIYLTVVSPTAKVNQIPNLNTWKGGIKNPIEYELKWEPAPGANYYEVSGFERCSSYEPRSREWNEIPGSSLYRADVCTKRTAEPGSFLSETMHEIQEEETYEILIAACYSDNIDCHVWTTATINAQRSGSESNLHVSPGTQFDELGYLFEWEHNPEASRYRLWIGECPDDSSTCSPRSRTILTWEPNETAFVYMRDGILDYGKRYLAELYYCPPGAENRDCIAWTETIFTTQARDN